MKYEDFPLVLFIRLLNKPEELAHRVIGQGNWERIKAQWETENEDHKGEAYLEARKNVTIQSARLNKLVLLVHWLKKTQKDPRPIFEECRIPWNDDKTKREETLDKLVAKSRNLLENYEAKLKYLKDQQKDEEPEEPFTISKLYEVIASLELFGFDIPEYDKLTIGRYKAMTAVINKRIQDEQRRANPGE